MIGVNVEIHPAAEIFPLIEGAAFAELVEDIKRHGLHEPITLDRDGRVLDGRNRLRACEQAGVEPVFRTWEGEGSAVEYVISLNLHRRHLNPSQLAMVAAKIANMRQGERTDIQPSANLPKVSVSDAAGMVNVSERSVGTARAVLNEGQPELVRAVERGEISVSAASEATAFEPEVQREVVQRVEAGEKLADVIKDYKPHVSNNSGNNEWYTPSAYILAAREAMGAIDVDPASSAIANKTVGAATFFTSEDDGLSQTWRGNVWMNPPYAQPLVSQFADAVSEKFEQKEIKRACVLVNNATETAWFQRMLTTATAVCLLKGRVKFIDPSGNPSGAPLQGQAVIYMGENPARFSRAFGDLGQVLVKE